MGNKYLIHGATFCGDGTTSAEAASAGAAGAWNNINVFEGTAPAYGALVAGDNVYIRSKSGNGVNANITRTSTVAVNIGSASATQASPITWIIDAGSVWSGVSGTITETTTTAVGITVTNYNNLIASNYNLVFSNTVASFGNTVFFLAHASITKDVKIDLSSNTAVPGPNNQFNGGKHINMWIRHGAITHAPITFVHRDIDVSFISLKLEILGPLYFAQDATAVFHLNDMLFSRISFYGGEVITGFADLVLVKHEVFPVSIEFFGLKYPASFSTSQSAMYAYKTSTISNGNDGVLGSTYYDYYFTFSSRFDGFYPTLNAQLESSGATPWAYSIYPYRTTKTNPVQVSVAKLWTQSAAQKTVTLEFLWPTTFPTPGSTSVWMTVQYIDASTGNKVTQSTLAYPDVSCATSAASWTATTYGPTQFNKYKLALTTQSNIKQDTQVIVSFFSTPRAASANDIIMICPDVVLS